MDSIINGRVVQRTLTQSSLYKEDVLPHGHTSVWGSFYDKKTSCWGYACCMSTVKDEPCSLSLQKMKAEAEASAKAARSAAAQTPPADALAKKDLDNLSALELQLRIKSQTNDDYL